MKRRPFSIFRNFELFETLSDTAYGIYKGIAIKQTWDNFNRCYWYSFRSYTDYLNLCGRLIGGF